jgi:iron complex outermembrane recepter protein
MFGAGGFFDYYANRQIYIPDRGGSMSTSKYAAQAAVPVKSTLAVAVSMALTGQTETAHAQDDGVVGIEEITVTARKREQSLQDISASVQAITGDDLKRQGLANMEDVVRFLPSVSHVGGTAGANKIIFRGVSDNPGAFIAASSAAIYIDEQPLTQFSINPEPRLVDIERVEALAGPQGTLYGDSSQSGTLRIITNKPDPTAFSASGDVMVRSGQESSESYEISGMLNLPLVEDKFAIRLVGFSATDGGFIDNVLGVSPMQGTKDNSAVVGKDINSVDHLGGRVSAKWFMNDNWSATAAVLYQKTEAAARNDYDPSVGDLQTVKFYKDRRDDTWSQSALTIEGSFGDGFELISITSYFERDIDYIYDRTTYSAYFNYNFCSAYAAYCWSGQTRYDQDTVGYNSQVQNNTRLTQELRLSRATDNTRWVVGAFYEDKSEYWEYRARTPEFLSSLSYYTWTSPNAYGYTPSNVDPSWWLSVDDTQWNQWAVFGNFSMDFNDHWSAEIGIRYFDITNDRRYFVDKPFIISPNWPDVTNPPGGNSGSVPKVSVTYRIDDEKMLYTLYSEGFRDGGANRNRTPFTVFPQAYDPDKLKNFEVGAKTRWMDGRVQVNATAFFMQWKNYQIEAVDPSFQPCGPNEIPDVDLCSQPFQVMVANVGDAQQTGLELDIKAIAGDNLDLGFNATFLDAKTSEDFFVTTTVPKGTRLPNVPDTKLNTFAQFNWPVNFVSNGAMYARLQVSYQSDSRSQLEFFDETSGTPTRIQAAYTIADMQIGLLGERWELQGFINNIGDERAQIYNDVFFFDNFFGRDRMITNRPREYGVRLSMRWGN